MTNTRYARHPPVDDVRLSFTEQRRALLPVAGALAVQVLWSNVPLANQLTSGN